MNLTFVTQTGDRHSIPVSDIAEIYTVVPASTIYVVALNGKVYETRNIKVEAP